MELVGYVCRRHLAIGSGAPPHPHIGNSFHESNPHHSPVQQVSDELCWGPVPRVPTSQVISLISSRLQFLAVPEPNPSSAARFTNLRKLITALTLSILPMFNAFMLFLLISSIYAIMGVSIFGHDYPEDFMVFDRAFLALFRITAGDTWVPSLPVLRDDGSLNWRGAAFVISYIMWVSSNHRSRVVLPLYLLYFSVSANHEFEVNSFCLV
mmetsp:Transcript_60743/g.162379  ORF Transcript_60743/g.162379 Transcript_60743/m.162379 type:complete len:210 (+) Transcript_60743:817-1446(+)